MSFHPRHASCSSLLVEEYKQASAVQTSWKVFRTWGRNYSSVYWRSQRSLNLGLCLSWPSVWNIHCYSQHNHPDLPPTHKALMKEIREHEINKACEMAQDKPGDWPEFHSQKLLKDERRKPSSPSCNLPLHKHCGMRAHTYIYTWVIFFFQSRSSGVFPD